MNHPASLTSTESSRAAIVRALIEQDSHRWEVVAAGLSCPTAVAVTPQGVIYLAESLGPWDGGPPATTRLWRFLPGRTGELLIEDLPSPISGMSADARGVVIAEGGWPARLSRVDHRGQLRTITDPVPSRGGGRLTGVALGPDGRIWVALGALGGRGIAVDGQASVMTADPEGRAWEIVATGFNRPSAIAVMPDGRPIVVDRGIHDQGGRAIAPDVIHVVRQNGWYGWPELHVAADGRWRAIGGDGPLGGAVRTPPDPVVCLPVGVSAHGLAIRGTGPHGGHVLVSRVGEPGASTDGAGMDCVDPASWSIHPGPATAATRPVAVARDALGGLLVCDLGPPVTDPMDGRLLRLPA